MRRIGWALALGFVIPAVAHATTVLRFNTAELVQRADLIVHGVCTGAQGRETRDGVVTDYRIEVKEALKRPRPAPDTEAPGTAKAGAILTFTTYGGVVAGRGTFIPGAPTIQVDEEVVLFLDAENAAKCRLPIGLSQGKYGIKADEQGKKHAYRNLEGLRLVDRTTGTIEEAGTEQGVPLDDLLATIKTHLKSTR